MNWIGPTTLLTRFAKELRRAPAAGDFEFRIGEGIAHAKDAKGGKEYRGGRFCPAVAGRAFARMLNF